MPFVRNCHAVRNVEEAFMGGALQHMRSYNLTHTLTHTHTHTHTHKMMSASYPLASDQDLHVSLLGLGVPRHACKKVPRDQLHD
jgi:hypothetical protein